MEASNRNTLRHRNRNRSLEFTSGFLNTQSKDSKSPSASVLLQSLHCFPPIAGDRLEEMDATDSDFEDDFDIPFGDTNGSDDGADEDMSDEEVRLCACPWDTE